MGHSHGLFGLQQVFGEPFQHLLLQQEFIHDEKSASQTGVGRGWIVAGALEDDRQAMRRTIGPTGTGCYSDCVQAMNPVTQTVITMITTPSRGVVIVRMST
jgi:hypothetical protein